MFKIIKTKQNNEQTNRVRGRERSTRACERAKCLVVRWRLPVGRDSLKRVLGELRVGNSRERAGGVHYVGGNGNASVWTAAAATAVVVETAAVAVETAVVVEAAPHSRACARTLSCHHT